MKRPRTKSAPRITVKAGDYALIGGTAASFPNNWFLALVLWADHRDVLLDRRDGTGTEQWRQLEPIGHVRAVGSIEQLVAVKETARLAVRELAQKADEATEAMGRAREAVWAKLEEMADAGLTVNPDMPAATSERSMVETLDEVYDDLGTPA